MLYHRIPPFIPGNRRATARFCPVPNIPGPPAPVQVEFDIFATALDCLFATVNCFSAETLPPVSRVTVLYMGGRDGVTGGAA